MIPSSIAEIINSILIKNNKVSITNFDESTHLRNQLGFDSLDLAELTVRIENEFGIDIFEDGIVETIGEILEKLEKK